MSVEKVKVKHNKVNEAERYVDEAKDDLQEFRDDLCRAMGRYSVLCSDKIGSQGRRTILNSAFGKIAVGQILLIICCIFYLIWWSISYRPGVEVNRAGGLNGILLMITAFCGLAGVFVSIYGANVIPKTSRMKITGGQAVIGWILIYVILLIITRFIFRRQVTTELLLITGWAALEITVISSLDGAGKLSDTRFFILFAVIVAAVVVSMILYVLYYRMEEMKAFYAAMVPLITEAISMAAVLLVTLI